MEFVDPKFKIGNVVCLKTDQHQAERIVISYTVTEYGVTDYKLACGTDSSDHKAMEIRKTKNIKKTLNITE